MGRKNRAARRTPSQAAADRQSDELAARLGLMLRDARQQRRVTQREAAEIAGLSPSAWSWLEIGRDGRVTLATVNRAAIAVGSSLNVYLKQTSAAGQPRVQSGDELWSVAAVRTEILAEARSGEEAAIVELLDQLRWLDVNSQLADAAGRLAAAYRRSYSGVDTVAYLVGAGAQELGAHLLTLNVKHFPMFPGLEPAY